MYSEQDSSHIIITRVTRHENLSESVYFIRWKIQKFVKILSFFYITTRKKIATLATPLSPGFRHWSFAIISTLSQKAAHQRELSWQNWSPRDARLSKFSSFYQTLQCIFASRNATNCLTWFRIFRKYRFNKTQLVLKPKHLVLKANENICEFPEIRFSRCFFFTIKDVRERTTWNCSRLSD